jgi:Papain-like cysteine protease AvrRpt2
MKLFIDGEAALSSSIGQPYRMPRPESGEVRLPIEIPPQEGANLCWAAIAVGFGAYFETAQLTQTEIATGQTAGDDREARLDRALRQVGCFSHWSPGKPQFARIRYEINAGRPLAARIAWDSGGAHYAAIIGYREEALLLADPLHGASVILHTEFPTRYREGGTWSESFWTSITRSLRGPADEHP